MLFFSVGFTVKSEPYLALVNKTLRPPALYSALRLKSFLAEYLFLSTTNMDIQLYIYDLSKGLAKALSLGLLGIQIDAVYHTSIVFEGIEYVYDGGIKTVQPGKTHLGPPMQTLDLGITSLPMDVIMEYLESLKEIYTPEVVPISSTTGSDC